jgi:uncharacterized membrane protein SpoIIM required for sporulation
MIIDLQKFIFEARPNWSALESLLDKLETEPEHRMNLSGVKRFHYLYQQASSDLSKLKTFSAEPNTRRYLESLVGRAYAEIHGAREKAHRFAPLRWFLKTFPRTFRRYVRAFWLAQTAMLVGSLLGAFILAVAPDSKSVLLPFPHLLGDPSERVAREEGAENDRLENAKTSFSAYLMTHNTRVSIFTLALGVTWGIGTAIMLFYNGVILGAVAWDYIMAGEAQFLLGWLLPHGAIEIPAILLAGQAGLVLAGAIIGWGQTISLKMRLRKIVPDLVTLIMGVALMLVWAGIVEAFLSQYHEPVIPYGAKIGFGALELLLLVVYLTKSGKKADRSKRIADSS